MSHVQLNGEPTNQAHVFVWEDEDLVAKFWFYGDGSVRYREWKRKSREEITKGETLVLKLQRSTEEATEG